MLPEVGVHSALLELWQAALVVKNTPYKFTPHVRPVAFVKIAARCNSKLSNIVTRVDLKRGTA
jgi:hypothetical protein